MKTDDRFWVWLLLAAVLALVFLAIVWSSAFAEDTLPPTPTPGPTMQVCVQERPTPTPAPYPWPDPNTYVYLPLVNVSTADTIISYLPPLPTPAPTMNPFPCGSN